MAITIKNDKTLKEFIKYITNNPSNPICYVYYKNELCFPNADYVGFTKQTGVAKYKYLKNHHKMGYIKHALNENYNIKIYVNSNENDLIRFLKPKLNYNCGIGICRKHNEKILPLLCSPGLIFGDNDKYVRYTKKLKYNKKYSYDDLFWNFWNYDDGHCHSKTNVLYKFYNYIIDIKIIKHMCHKLERYDKKPNWHLLRKDHLFSILTICKTKCYDDSIKLIIQIYKKHVASYENYIKESNTESINISNKQTLQSYKLTELRSMVKKKQIKGYSTVKKNENKNVYNI